MTSPSNQVINNRVSTSSDSGILLDLVQRQHRRGNNLNVIGPNAAGIELVSSNSNIVQSNIANSQLGNGIEVQNSASNRLLTNTANGDTGPAST